VDGDAAIRRVDRLAPPRPLRGQIALGEEAASLVRPSKSVLDLEPASVVKRMKDKAFARNVSRDDLRRGAEELNLPLEQHIGNVIRFMRERVDALGLRGTL